MLPRYRIRLTSCCKLLLLLLVLLHSPLSRPTLVHTSSSFGYWTWNSRRQNSFFFFHSTCCLYFAIHPWQLDFFLTRMKCTRIMRQIFWALCFSFPSGLSLSLLFAKWVIRQNCVSVESSAKEGRARVVRREEASVGKKEREKVFVFLATCGSRINFLPTPYFFSLPVICEKYGKSGLRRWEKMGSKKKHWERREASQEREKTRREGNFGVVEECGGCGAQRMEVGWVLPHLDLIHTYAL